MATPEEQIPFNEPSQEVVDTDDGGAIVQMEGDVSPDQAYEFYDNIVDMIPDDELTRLGSQLEESIERDKKSRERRDKEYAEAIKRTGLGKEAPGGAEFTGASRAVHPMLTEAAVDYGARAVKELLPPNGPVKTYIPGENINSERMEKADRVKNYMNWQFLKQMKGFRPELEQLLPQNALSGSQYMRITPDWSKNKTRPCPRFVPQDQIYIPYSASNFYTAERQTYAEPVTKMEFEDRVKDGMYKDISPLVNAQMPEATAAQKATDKVEGKDSYDFYNEDGLRIIYEINTFIDMEGDTDAEGTVPYLISMDEPTKKIVAVVRNWEQEDEYQERMQWIIEFPFIPWRGAYSVGLGQMIGSLSGAATGALRALLDSAHVNNIPTAVRLKGANFIGQSKTEIQATQIVELDGGIAGDDIRKLLLHLPFNPPSPVLYELLGFLVDAGRGVVRTTFEQLSDQNPNMPVGTTLAMIEEGMQVMSAIHLRTYHAMTMVIEVIHRINKMYLTDDEVTDEVGELLAYREDFQGPMDVVPTADPQVFSDVQRLAQLQIVAERAAALPDLYNQRAVEKRLLDRTKIPNPDELLIPEQKPEWMNAVNENTAMSLQRPVSAFPEQDHLAHLQVHLDFLLSPVFGQNPVIAPNFTPPVLEHIKEHMVLWYVQENYNLLEEALETDDEGMKTVMAEQDPETKAEMDRTLAQASPVIIKRGLTVFEQLPGIIQQAMQMMQQFQPQPPALPVDPNAQAETERRKQADQMRAQADATKDETKRIELDKDEGIEFAKLSAQEREQAVEKAHEDAMEAQKRAARLEELLSKERAEDERTATEIESGERRNTQDNLTALTIAAAELEAGKKSNLSTGTGINPSGS
jgi:hypothetical protein